MKKKTIALVLSIAMIAVAVIGGTMAYFTDTEEATNTFTAGKVDISIIERNLDESEFTQDQRLYPGTAKKNAVAKNVLVKVEKGSEDCYVWVDLLVPTELYLDKENGNESANGLHFNQFIDYLQNYEGRSSNPNAQTIAKLYEADHQWSEAKYAGEKEIDGKKYAILRTMHKDIMKAEDVSSPAMSQVYMDWRVYTTPDGKYMVPANPQATQFKEYTGLWKMEVEAYAIQAAGIDDVKKAVETYYSQSNPI